MSTKAPAYGERIEVLDDGVWVSAEVINARWNTWPAFFWACNADSYKYLRCDREGTSWRRVKEEA